MAIFWATRSKQWPIQQPSFLSLFCSFTSLTGHGGHHLDHPSSRKVPAHVTIAEPLAKIRNCLSSGDRQSLRTDAVCAIASAAWVVAALLFMLYKTIRLEQKPAESRRRGRRPCDIAFVDAVVSRHLRSASRAIPSTTPSDFSSLRHPQPAMV